MKKFIPLLILLFAMAVLGQNEPSEILVDEFGPITCDDFLARIDNFYIHVNANPGSKGYFVIAGSNELLERKLTFELLFESAVGWRGLDRSLTSVVRGPEGGPLEVKLWIVKPNGHTPTFGETKWDLRLRPGSAPFLVRSDMSQICDPPPVDRLAKELLEANPDGAIYVVVHAPTVQQRRKELRIAKRMLSAYNPLRIRYLLRHSSAAYSDYYFAVGRPKRTDFKSDF